MEDILKKVDLEIHDIYEITINIGETSQFEDVEEGQPTHNSDGESLDSVSQVRRGIKHSAPFENKKIIKNISVSEDIEDSEGYLCKNIQIHYFLLIDKEEECEEFSTVELHDILEEEWRDGSSGCDIKITLLEDLT